MTTDVTAPGEGPVRLQTPSEAGLAGVLRPADHALPVPRAGDRSAWDRSHGSVDRVTLEAVLGRAEGDLGRPWPWPSARAYARYFRDGDREEYQEAVFARQERLSRAAVAAAVTLEAGWLDEVADGVTALLEQSTWCWPAHDDTFTTSGSFVPTSARPFLDLGAGEVVAQLAWVDHLLGDELDRAYPGLRARVRHEADVRVLQPFVTRRDWHWLGTPGDVHNWNPWIHGSVVVAALQLLRPERDDLRRQVVALALAGTETYTSSLPEDGAVDEGFGYWWNGAARALELLDVLRHASGGRLGETPGALRATVAFPHRMHLGGPWYANLADASARAEEDLPWRVLHRAAEVTEQPDARRLAAAHRRPGQPASDERRGLGRLLQALADRTWTGAAPERPPLPRQSWFPSTQVLVAREREGEADGLALVVKGGHNGENHNHNDVGSVVVGLGGVPVVVDVGRPTYTAQTFGPDRYAIWTMQSSWHALPEVRGSAQAPGHEHAARDVVVDDDPASPSTGLSLDIAGAYPRGDVRSWRREARLDRDRRAVEVVETWDLEPAAATGAGPATVLHLVVAGAVALDGDGVVVEALEGAGRARITCRAGGELLPVRAEHRALDDPLLRGVWGEALTRLVVELPATGSGTAVTTVEEVR